MRRSIAMLLGMALALVACAGSDTVETTAEAEATTTVVGSEPTTTAVAPETTTTTMAATTTTEAPATTVAATGGSSSDECLVGTWNPDQQQFEDLLLTLYRSVGVSNLQLEGTLDLTFGADGSFSQEYAGVRGSGEADGVTVEATFSGGSFGTWEAADDTLTINFTGSDIEVTVNGVGGPAPSIPPASVDAGFECEGSNLTVEPPPNVAGGFWPLPVDWTRVDG